VGGRVVGVRISSRSEEARAERNRVAPREVGDRKGPAVLKVVRARDHEVAAGVALEIEGVPGTKIRVGSEIDCPTEEIEGADAVEPGDVHAGRWAVNCVGAAKTVADGNSRGAVRLEERVVAECVYILHAGVAQRDDQTDIVPDREVEARNSGDIVDAGVGRR
jgi:hypothetical protein